MKLVRKLSYKKKIRENERENYIKVIHTVILGYKAKRTQWCGIFIRPVCRPVIYDLNR